MSTETLTRYLIISSGGRRGGNIRMTEGLPRLKPNEFAIAVEISTIVTYTLRDERGRFVSHTSGGKP